MALPVGFQGANFTFAAPEGQEDKVRDLHVARFPTHSVSCWRLTEAELAEVIRTGVVWLTVAGQGMYPVLVQGEAPFEGPPPKAEPFLERDR